MADNNNYIKIKHGTSDNLPLEVSPGQILFTTDERKIYLDTPGGTEHLEMYPYHNIGISIGSTQTGTSKAGGKAFRVVEVTDNGDKTGVYTIGIEDGAGDENPASALEALNNILSTSPIKCHAQLGEARGDLETITSIDIANQKITVSNFDFKSGLKRNKEGGLTISDPNDFYQANYLIIMDHPELGNIEVGFNARAEGESNNAQEVDSHVEGYNTKAIGKYSHAEGNSTIAGFAAHAEGRGSQALGVDSHAEGANTKAMGTRSHAEGNATQALGTSSHAEGHNTIANHDYQHVSGTWNEPGDYAVIVGNGKDSQSPRSNAYTLDWEGNGWFAGKVTVEQQGDGEKDLATIGQVNQKIEQSETTINGKIENIENSIGDLPTEEEMTSAINTALVDVNSSVQENTENIEDLDIRVSTLENNTTTTSWKNVQDIVRRGFGPEVYPVGYQFTVHHEDYEDIIFDVVAHNYLKSVDDENAPTMTLLAHNSILTTQFDAREALYVVNSDEELSADTLYCIADERTGYVSYYNLFRFSEGVPSNSKLLYKYEDKSIKNIRYYNEENGFVDADYYEQTTTRPTDITILGNVRIPDFKNTNHNSRAQNGNNNYKESAIRQFLNSSNEKGKWWKAQNKFDMPTSDVSKIDGFLFGMDKKFLEIVGKVKLPCFTHNNGEAAPEGSVNTSYDITEDLFYLPSLKEIISNLTNSSDITENDNSILLPYYNKASDVDKIKYDLSDNTAFWFSRSPYLTNAITVRGININGTINSYNAMDNRGIVPMCTIV